MKTQQKCEHCGSMYDTQVDIPQEAWLMEKINLIFVDAGEIKTSIASSAGGLPLAQVETFSVGIRIPHTMVVDNPITEEQVRENSYGFLVYRMHEVFSRVFGETRSSRRIWWREKPNILYELDWDTRAHKFVLWFRVAIENLTEEERQQLITCITAEGEHIRYEDPGYFQDILRGS